MRDFKYRAWHEEKKGMYQVAQVDMWGDPDQATCELASWDEELFDIYLNEVKIMQFTGLKDIDGQEIYEGDIISFDDCTSTESGYYEQQCIGVVEWCNETASFEISNRLSAESEEVFEDCFVAGNIFENPELLEG